MTPSLQWAPSGNMLDGKPENMVRFLASAEGKTFGYGWGPGWSIMFGTEHGDITLLPGQWVIKNDDGTFTVSDNSGVTE